MSRRGWKTHRLGDLCTKIGSGATPRGGKETYLDEGPFALVRSQNVLDFFCSTDGLAFINQEQANQLNNVELKERDVLLNITGDSVARVCQISSSLLPGRVNQHVSILRPDESKLIPEFLKYYLLNPSFKNYMLGLASVGGTRNALTKGMIEEFEIEVPPHDTQRRISAILSALDEKIELNRQTNATMETIAQVLFKEWFVDFRFPGATGRMQEGELGPIPLNWKVGVFQDVLDIQIGGDWGKEELFKDSLPAISLRGTDLEELKTFGYAPKAPLRWIIKSSLERRLIGDTDILIAGSGLGPIGRSLYCDTNLSSLYDFPITYSNFCRRLKAKSLGYAIYAERLLESIYNSGEMRQYFTGTSIPNLDVHSLLGYRIIIPEADIVEKYAKKIGVEKFKKLYNMENSNLANVRDSLLCKLINGDIAV
jgi:type I restriction enzyme S subunit